jgi:hypothetical protein
MLASATAKRPGTTPNAQPRTQLAIGNPASNKGRQNLETRLCSEVIWASLKPTRKAAIWRDQERRNRLTDFSSSPILLARPAYFRVADLHFLQVRRLAAQGK